MKFAPYQRQGGFAPCTRLLLHPSSTNHRDAPAVRRNDKRSPAATPRRKATFGVTRACDNMMGKNKNYSDRPIRRIRRMTNRRSREEPASRQHLVRAAAWGAAHLETCPPLPPLRSGPEVACCRRLLVAGPTPDLGPVVTPAVHRRPVVGCCSLAKCRQWCLNEACDMHPQW